MSALGRKADVGRLQMRALAKLNRWYCLTSLVRQPKKDVKQDLVALAINSASSTSPAPSGDEV